MNRTGGLLLSSVMGVVGFAGCGGGNAASGLAKPPELEMAGQTKCGVAASRTRPLIVEWPSSDLMDLEQRSKQGLVVVNYNSCKMELAPAGCKAPGGYKYIGLTHHRDRVRVKTADDLYTHLPLGAASLEAKLQSSGELNVEMTLVGKLESD